jgi:cytochrome P450
MPGMGSTDNTTSRTIPPGPANPLRTTMAFQRGPLGLFDNLIKNYGDISTFRLAANRVVLLRHPHHVRHILQQKYGNYDRSTTSYKMARNLFGRGLATVEGGEEWRGMRRMMQPSFHYQRVASMTEHMVAVIHARLDHWDRMAAAGEVLDTNTEMRRLTLRVVARALFALDDEAVIDRFADAIDTIDEELTAYMRFPLLPLSVPTAGHRRFWSNHAIVEEIIDYVITQHFNDDVDRGDLLSVLIRTEDEDTGARLSDEELRDQVFVMLFAGHETGANVLTWTWYQLGMHPEVQQRVQQEVDRELDGRPATLADCTKLTYTQTVIDETQRMYPQQWQGWRRALEDDEIDGYRIPAGTDIFYSPYHVHRHPDFWDAPETFRPERFTPEEVARRDRSAYLPFGSGPHKCIGNQFALTEMMLVIASTMQRYRIELESQEHIAPKPLITLGPEKPVRVRLVPRTRHGITPGLRRA